MAKRIEIDGKFYRKRDGKLVEIPPEWVGKTLDSQTKRKRPSKWSAAQKRNVARNPLKDGTWPNNNYRQRRWKIKEEE